MADLSEADKKAVKLKRRELKRRSSQRPPAPKGAYTLREFKEVQKQLHRMRARPGAGPMDGHTVAIFQKTQAERIIDKFGGARELLRCLEETFPDIRWHASTIYRWTYPRASLGTGGIIPPQSLKYVLKASRHAGLLLTADDIAPGRR